MGAKVLESGVLTEWTGAGKVPGLGALPRPEVPPMGMGEEALDFLCALLVLNHACSREMLSEAMWAVVALNRHGDVDGMLREFHEGYKERGTQEGRDRMGAMARVLYLEFRSAVYDLMDLRGVSDLMGRQEAG